jgi:NADPH-dependent ferric siderophore reductase
VSPVFPFYAVTVTAAAWVTPRMRRVTVGGSGMDRFQSTAADQYVKLFFPLPGQGPPQIPPVVDDVPSWHRAYLAMPDDRRPPMRTYTIRRHHPDRNEVDIDFALDGIHGPGSRWAASAAPGDPLGMLGPAAIEKPADGDWRLLIGDATALPAIGAIAEQLSSGTKAIVFVEVADAAEHQAWDTPADVDVHWVHLDGAAPGDGERLLDALRAAQLAPGRPLVWIAGESGMVKALRRHAVSERGIDKRSVAFSGYWRRGKSEDQLTKDDVDGLTE